MGKLVRGARLDDLERVVLMAGKGPFGRHGMR